MMLFNVGNIRHIQATVGLQLVANPHPPDELVVLPFKLFNNINPERMERIVDDRIAAYTTHGQRQFL